MIEGFVWAVTFTIAFNSGNTNDYVNEGRFETKAQCEYSATKFNRSYAAIEQGAKIVKHECRIIKDL